MIEVGRVCIKIAGRDAGRKCVVVEILDNSYVVVDGNVRRKKVNMRHLEPLDEVIEIKAKATHEDVKAAFEKLNEKVWDKKSKEVAERPKKQKKKKEKPVKDKKAKKKAEKKEEKSVEKKAEEKSVEDVVAEVPKEGKVEEKAAIEDIHKSEISGAAESEKKE